MKKSYHSIAEPTVLVITIFDSEFEGWVVPFNVIVVHLPMQ